MVEENEIAEALANSQQKFLKKLKKKKLTENFKGYEVEVWDTKTINKHLRDWLK